MSRVAVVNSRASGAGLGSRPTSFAETAAWFRGELREDASARWGVRGGAAELLFLVPAVGAVLFAAAGLLAAAELDRGLFEFVVREDSLLEWAQVAGFLGGFVGGAALAARAFRSGRVRVALAYAVFAAACFFVLGEEVSWGQRLLGFGTPESLKEINDQDEVTLHNLGEVRVLMKLFLISLGLAGAVLPWVLRIRGSRLAGLMPPLFTTTTFLLIFGYNAARLIFFPEGFFGREENFIVGRYGEWPETCLAFLTVGFAWLALRRPAADPRTLNSDL
jgi:hypothetical protein